MNTATLTEVHIPRHPRFGDPIGLVVSCDRCGRRNHHGAGLDPGNIHDFLGHRHADCGCPGGYHIVDPGRIVTKGQAA